MSAPYPNAICGRWGGQGPEWTVAVGMRVVRVGVDPVVYPRRDAIVTGFLPGQVVLTCEDNSVAWDLSRFWDEWRPAPPESRWLDPASVPKAGEALEECCSSGLGKCPYPAAPGEGGRLEGYCAACSLWMTEHPAEPCPGRPVLPPSVLTPVPRWRALQGYKWNAKIPRIRKHDFDSRYWHWQNEGGFNSVRRVRKVRAASLAPGIPCAFDAAKWV